MKRRQRKSKPGICELWSRFAECHSYLAGSVEPQRIGRCPELASSRIVQGWETGSDAPPLATYEPGSWGPAEADDFLARDGRIWCRGCTKHKGG